MAVLSVTIPDAIVTRVLNAVVYNNGYTDTIPDMAGGTIPNPVTKAQFAKNVVKEYLKANVVAYEAAKAGDTARAAAQTAAQNEITIQD